MTNAPLRILIVDDNADAARMLTIFLKSEGHETCTASDGPEAIDAAKLYRPDLVILDLTLPSMSGIEVARELRRITELAACRLVAVSGYGREHLPYPSPFDNHFLKPVNLAELLEYLSGLPDAQKPPCASMAVA
jgi:two-component system, chemotaxis family, CheB/CheR fusion protein